MALQATKQILETTVDTSKTLLCNNKTYFLKPVTQFAYLMKAHVFFNLPDAVQHVQLNQNAIDEEGRACFKTMFTHTKACGGKGMWVSPSNLHLPLISNIISKSIQYNGKF